MPQPSLRLVAPDESSDPATEPYEFYVKSGYTTRWKIEVWPLASWESIPESRRPAGAFADHTRRAMMRLTRAEPGDGT